MIKSFIYTNKEIAEIYERHLRTVYRICFAFMKNLPDVDDAVSDTFFKMIQSGATFESTEHEKAWLIRAATNICKNKLKHWWRKNRPLEELENKQLDDHIEIDSTLSVVLDLPDKYKTVVYLYYYEQYTGAEIAAILKKPHSTIRNHLHEARAILKKKLGDDFIE